MLVLVVHMCHNWEGLLFAFLFPVLWEDFQVRSGSDSPSPVSKVCGVFISWYHLVEVIFKNSACVYVCVTLTHAHVTGHPWRSEDNFWEVSFLPPTIWVRRIGHQS